jgi:hypothetical protein
MELVLCFAWLGAAALVLLAEARLLLALLARTGNPLLLGIVVITAPVSLMIVGVVAALAWRIRWPVLVLVPFLFW